MGDINNCSNCKYWLQKRKNSDRMYGQHLKWKNQNCNLNLMNIETISTPLIQNMQRTKENLMNQKNNMK